MSQAGEIDITGTHPEIPTEFIANVGTAVPIANQIEILGTYVVAAGIPVETTASGNTLVVDVQLASETAASDVTQVGLAAFDSGAFTVDANGFVTLNGGGGAATDINVDAHTAPGTDPVVPAAGQITITGGQVATGTIGANVIRTNSLAANTFTIEIQRSTAVAATDSTKNGVSHFNSAEFSVDADGYVSLAGGGLAVDSFAMQTGTSPVVPAGTGLVTFNGAVVAAGTNPVRTDGTGANTMALEIQISQALAATDATKIGLANFDSAAFDVDANGFVQLNGGGIAATSFDVQANTAPGTDPVVPSASGVVVVNGAVVANHSVVLETRSRAVNAYNLEVQYSASAAATDGTKSGVAHFDSARFTVDSVGFVSLNGSGVGQTITGNSGGALSPTAGNWNILGASTAAGTSPVTTSGAVSTLTVNVQKSQAIASTDATKVGLAAFDSAAFSVDANGFVTLAGGTEAIDSIGVDATSGGGTNPVLPTAAGLVTVNGARVAAGTNPVRTVSTAANVYQIQVQTSQALAATDATKVGLANFNSAQFSVDANGFVSSLGAGFPWLDTSGTVTAAVNTGYFITTTCTSTLPASPAQGDTVRYFVDTTNILTITAAGSQVIRVANTVSAAGGTCVNTQRGDAIELVYRTSGTQWCAVNNPSGAWTTS